MSTTTNFHPTQNWQMWCLFTQKNDNLNIMNYRPVSILSSMSKVLEKLILRQMNPFLRKILDPRIVAYRQGYSCQDVLIRLAEDWKRVLENRKHVGAVLMDLSKAFDCLPHQLLVAKLRAYGACDRSCALIWSYLSGRRQRVRIGCSTSDWLPLTKGVSQGSVLAPVLFNLFINDLYAVITKSTLYNYADDNTISACCDTEQLVVETLTSEVKVAIKWFDTNRMEANPSKFQAITVNAAEDPRAHINLGDKVIIAESTVKLLGVHFIRRPSQLQPANQRAVPQISESVERSATSSATSRSRLQNVHLSSVHTDTLQLLCASVALLWRNKYKETRAHPM